MCPNGSRPLREDGPKWVPDPIWLMSPNGSQVNLANEPKWVPGANCTDYGTTESVTHIVLFGITRGIIFGTKDMVPLVRYHI